MQNTVDLNEICGGALKEQFEVAWEKLIENVLDPNVASKNARTLTIKIAVKPNGDRTLCHTIVKVSSSLPADNPIETQISIGTINGKPSVREYRPEQQTLGV